jgi:hypothetical protein
MKRVQGKYITQMQQREGDHLMERRGGLHKGHRGLGFAVSCLQRMTIITYWDTRRILVEYTLVLCAHNVGDCCNHLFTVNRVCAVKFSLISL